MGYLFGLVNQLLLAALALGLLCVIVWGYRMWWQRRPTRADRTAPLGSTAGAGSLAAGPPLVVVVLLLVAAAVGWALPMLGISLAAFLVLDLRSERSAALEAEDQAVVAEPQRAPEPEGALVVDQGVELDRLVAPAFEQRGEAGPAEAFAPVVAADEILPDVDAVLVVAPDRVRHRQPVTFDECDCVVLTGDPPPHPVFEVGLRGGAVVALVLDEVPVHDREERDVSQVGRANGDAGPLAFHAVHYPLIANTWQ